jgi:hypothetical protein
MQFIVNDIHPGFCVLAIEANFDLLLQTAATEQRQVGPLDRTAFILALDDPEVHSIM